MPEICLCPTCHQPISERKITIYFELLITLWRVYVYCLRNNKHEFHRKEIKSFFRSENDTARFGDLVLFGGLVYRPEHKKGYYGLNIDRCDRFFGNVRSIPTAIFKNPVTGNIRIDKEQYLEAISPLKAFLDKDGEYVTMYREPKGVFTQQLRLGVFA